MTVSMVARQACTVAIQLFQWKMAYSEGCLVAVGANEAIFQNSEACYSVRQRRRSHLVCFYRMGGAKRDRV